MHAKELYHFVMGNAIDFATVLALLGYLMYKDGNLMYLSHK